MKRIILIISTLLFGLAVKAQSQYTCRYWYDGDVGSVVTTGFDGSNWQAQLDVGALDAGLHFLHLQVVESQQVCGPTRSYLFMKNPIFEIDDLTYCCWFDQDVEHQYTGAFGNGSFLLDVSNLRDGLHFVHVLLEGSTLTTAKSYLFMKDPIFEMEDLTYRCWFDQDVEHQYTGAFGNGSFLLDVSNLRDGLHFVHILLEGCTLTTAKSYLFMKLPTSDEDLQYHCWFDQNYSTVQNGPVGNGVFLLDVSGLPIGEHEVILQLDNGNFFSPRSYNFYRTPMITVSASPTEGGTATILVNDSICTLTATANAGYDFVNWTMDGNIVSTENVYSFTMTEDAAFVANFELGTSITQTTNFNNGWNWWSSYIELDSSSLQDLENGLDTSGEMIKSQNNGYASYLDGFGWYGSLTAINNQSTYQVKTNGACTVELTGNATNSTNHPITLNSGWTWVGYPVNGSMSVAEALSGIVPQNNDMLKSQNNGYASYLENFGWYGSLSTLHPGMGLMYKSNNANAVTLVYPNNGTRTDLKANQTAESNYWQPNLNAYADNMSVMAVVELDGNELQGENYELAAFANGEVRGSARLLYVEPLNRYMAFLTIAGDEAAELHFGVYDTETDAVETQCVASLQYETNAVVGSFSEPYIVSFRGNMGVDEQGSGLHLYPNPAKTVIRIEGLATNTEVRIFNSLGELVKVVIVSADREIGIGDLASGIYLIRCCNTSLRFVKD